jgi:hypothetical protein
LKYASKKTVLSLGSMMFECIDEAMQQEANAMTRSDLRRGSLSTHSSLANEHLEIAPGQAFSGTINSGLFGGRKLGVVERLVGPLASTECTGRVGSLGFRSEREGHI